MQSLQFSIIVTAIALTLLVIFFYTFGFITRNINHPKSVVPEPHQFLNKETLRRWTPLFILGLICFVLAIYAVYSLKHGPEAKLAKDFISSNNNVINYFGNIRSISFSNQESSVENIGSGSRNGEYYFDIDGDKKAGTVKIRWESIELAGEDHNFSSIWSSSKGEQ
jgi:hypothetical protein